MNGNRSIPSGTFIVNRQASQVTMVWSCLPSRYAAKIILHGTVVAEEDRVNHGGTTSMNGQASHHRRCCLSKTTAVDGPPVQPVKFCDTRLNCSQEIRPDASHQRR